MDYGVPLSSATFQKVDANTDMDQADDYVECARLGTRVSRGMIEACEALGYPMRYDPCASDPYGHVCSNKAVDDMMAAERGFHCGVRGCGAPLQWEGRRALSSPEVEDGGEEMTST